MTSIDFVAGSHGNFLEFVCNRFIAKMDITFSPFNKLGASHQKSFSYRKNAVFVAKHYSELKTPLSKDVVRITFGDKDLLLLTSVSLLRAGDADIDNNMLNIDTFNKLNNIYYVDQIEKINQSYPEISLSADNPDCPRYILREFFKFGFRNSLDHGFIKKLNELQYSSEHNVFDFKFSWFYNSEVFVEQILNLANWYNNPIVDYDALYQLHQEFLERQIYKNNKTQCDDIINCVVNDINVDIPELTLFQESYINGMLEQQYSVEMPFVQHNYFKNTKEIINYICSK